MGILLPSSKIQEEISKKYRKIREAVEPKTPHFFNLMKQLAKTGLK